MDIKHLKAVINVYEAEKAIWEATPVYTSYEELKDIISTIVSQINIMLDVEDFHMSNGYLVINVEDQFGEPDSISINPQILLEKTGKEIKAHDIKIDQQIRSLKAEMQQAHSKAYLKLTSAMKQFDEVKQLKDFENTEFKAPELPNWYHDTKRRISSLCIQVEDMRKEKWIH
jgi:hypothetical protein